MIPTITMLYAGLLGLLLIVLSFRVVGFRRKSGTGIGDGDSEGGARLIRAHGNFTEYVPSALLILLLLELAGENPVALHVFGALLFLARIAHASGLSKASGATPGRFGGALVTFLLLIIGSIWLIVRSVMWQMG
ncbi:MAG: MAPEG family protein [Minwuia sp.]|nr:MAPEG family protein [Minwuia sp.]